MPKLLQRMTIGAKLPVIIGALVALTILVMSLANVVTISMIISNGAAEKLESISVLKSKRIQSLLDTIDRDIRLQADARATSQALIALADGYGALDDPEEVLKRFYIDENEYPAGEKDKLVFADTGSKYG
jgi:methyl-accepting chemotaxis protein